MSGTASNNAVFSSSLAWSWPPDRADEESICAIGVDEAGRGCLAGPVTAAAVVWRSPPPASSSSSADDAKLMALVRDSKTLSAKQRKRVAEFIRAHADAWAVGEASVQEIDDNNILRATMIAMHRAIHKVIQKVGGGIGSGQEAPSPQAEEARDTAYRLLIDGDRFTVYTDVATGFVPHACITEGDNKVVSIAAASILAKTSRDEHMRKMHEIHPIYGWERNAGYGTAQHMLALKTHGPCDLHRRSFAPVAAAVDAAAAAQSG